MPAGFRTFKADGSPLLSLDHRVLRLLTVMDVGTVTSGSVSVTGLTDGTVVVQTRNSATGNYQNPTVTVGTGSVSWNYGSTPTGQRDPNLALEIAVF